MGKKQKAMYTGLFLTESSKAALLSAVSVHTGLHPKILAHHLTLKFRPMPGEVKDLPMGATVAFQAIGYGADEKAQAVICTVPAGLTCANIHPHVTVALADDAKPVYSNELLAQGYTAFESPINLTARVGYSDGRNDYFDLQGSIYE